jgi:tRNA threonylcarbamoyladenosine biosynthesis protein TsaE
VKTITKKVNSLGQTSKLASKIASNLKGGEVICLVGELGVGKTYFVKFFAEALGIKGEEVISPTFVYWRKHKGEKFLLNHFDFYRISDEKDAESVGIEDAFSQEGAVTIIEWADRIPSYLPEDRLEISMKFLGETERLLEIKVYGNKCDYLLEGVE